MKNIMQIFITWYLVSSITYANLNRNNLEQYWDTSRAKIVFKYLKNNLERDCFLAVIIKKENIKPPLEKVISVFVNNSKYLETYKDTFFALDDDIYESLIEFYSTNLGKRYKSMMQVLDYISYNDSRNKYKEVDNTSTYMTNSDVNYKYNEIIKGKNFSDRKLKLISILIEELNFIDIEINYIKEFTLFKYQSVYPEKNITSDMVSQLVDKEKINIEKYAYKRMVILLYDFSEQDISELIKWESTKALSIELEYIYKASLVFSTQSYLDLKNNYKNLIMIRYCQDYPTDRGFIPEDCKKEWIHQEVTSEKEENLK